MLYKSSLLAACLALAASFAPASAQVRSNLLVAVDDVVDPVILPAYEVEYAVQVSNLSAAPMTNVTVSAETPEGTYFGEASTTVGALEAPAQGRSGPMVVTAETLAPGASMEIRFELGLEAGAGSQLEFTASVANAEGDVVEATETTFVVNRGDAVLEWEPLTFGPSLPQAPRLVRVERPTEPVFRQNLFPLVPASPALEYRVYRADIPQVATTEANLFAELPGSQQNTGALPPGFYVVTAVFGGVETTPSGVVSVGKGEPVVEKVTVKDGVLKARGSNFDATVTVTVDGLRFVEPAVVKREGTRVSQSGRLENGQTLSKYLKQHRGTALVAFHNANGSVAAAVYGPLTLGR